MTRRLFPLAPFVAAILVGVLSLACGSSPAPDLLSPNPTPQDDAGSGDANLPSPATDSGAPVVSPGADGSAEGAIDSGLRDAAMHEGGATPVDAGSAGDGSAPAARLAIPMYLDPTQTPSLWTEVFAAGSEVGILVVSTDSIGPGTSVDSTYSAAIASAHAAGQIVLGYTYTNSTMRAIATVEADVDAWYSFYPALDGIFVDEVSDDASTATSYYVPLYKYIKAKQATGTVAINPGTMVDEAFMSASDILLTYEDTYANFIDPSQNPPNPAWVATYPSSRFWNIVLSTDASLEVNAIELAKGRNAGWIYVTAEGPDTAYQNIETGTYWTTELSEVAAP